MHPYSQRPIPTQVYYPTCPPPSVDPDAIKEGDKNNPGDEDVPGGEVRATSLQTAKTGGANTSAIEKPEKSKGVLKESIVTGINKKE
jgi:hypothetical protein